MQTLTLAMLIICCSESLWIIAFFTTVDRINGYWQNVNLWELQLVRLEVTTFITIINLVKNNYAWKQLCMVSYCTVKAIAMVYIDPAILLHEINNIKFFEAIKLQNRL